MFALLAALVCIHWLIPACAFCTFEQNARVLFLQLTLLSSPGNHRAVGVTSALCPSAGREELSSSLVRCVDY